MFGVYRVILASAVVLLHLYGLPRLGNYAVFSFFVLSGFLMTTIMHEQYGYTLRGCAQFAINRALRLYPVNIFMCLIAVILILWLGDDFWRTMEKHIYMPQTAKDWFFNLTMIYPKILPNKVAPALSPSTWAITVELFYYVLICIGLSRNKSLVHVWLLVSVLYFAYTYYAGKGGSYRYSSIPAGSLPFAIGSAIYFYKYEFLKALQKIRLGSPGIVMIILLANPAIVVLSGGGTTSFLVNEISIYLNIILAAAMVTLLFFDGFKGISRETDARIGEYSYPMYLLHFQTGGLAAFLVFGRPVTGHSPDAFSSAWVGIPLLIVLSTIAVYGVDKNINKIRNRIKRGKQVGQ